jgi:hypothetical protein
MSEVMTILIYFHYSHYRDFKTYYLIHVCNNLKREFPNLLSYKRFVALIHQGTPLRGDLSRWGFQRGESRFSPLAVGANSLRTNIEIPKVQVFIPLCTYLQSLKKTSDGIAFVDSTTITVCHSKRISSHKVFAGLAAIGKSTKGWFYGFKLHLICNHKGDLVSCRITPGNVDDRAPLPEIVKNVFGKIFGDKGYISQALFDELFARGLQLITGIRKKMKNKLMLMFDKILLKKRALIESINNQLKFVFQIEHHRHRSPINGMINILCALVAYIHYPHKPSLNLTKKEELLLWGQTY